MAKSLLHERWMEYTDKEIVAIKRSKCINCPYKGVASARSSDASNIYCNYLEITGSARLIHPELCQHYLDVDVHRLNSKFGYSPSRTGLK